MNQPLLYIRNGYALYFGPISDNREHRHHMLQVAASLEKVFEVTLLQKSYSFQGGFIDADVPHRIDSGGETVCLILFDPEGPAAAGIRAEFGGGDWKTFSESWIDAHLREVIDAAKKCLPGDEMDPLVNKLFGAGEVFNSAGESDPRMDHLLDFLKSTEGKRCTAAEAANVIGLSESRMLHRFTEYTGIPFRRYLLWLRLRDAIDCITVGMNFTDAAHEAGFSDSAHLSRTFSDTFGMTLLTVFKSSQVSRFIQVIT